LLLTAELTIYEEICFMTRSSSLVLIAAIALTSFVAQPAVGQFNIPKIKIPKIPKTDTTTTTTTTTTTNSDPVTSNSDSSSSSRAKGDEDVRGIPIQGARITFSNSPDGSNPKTTFTSSEYVYGHLDLGGKTIAQAFGLTNMGDAKFYHIDYNLQVRKPGAEFNKYAWSQFSATLITKADAQKTSWDFDVLPDPAKVSTRSAADKDDLDNYKFVSGLYGQWYDVDAARSMFPQSGTYTIDITLFGNSYDDWGKPTGKIDEFRTVSAQFAFQFNGPDGQRLFANAVKAKEVMESAKNRAEMYHTMPDWWGKAFTGAEPKLAPARLVPLIKGYIGKWDLTYMKHMVWGFTGPVWVVQKNELGIPRYRNVNTTIYVIYKEAKDNSCQVGGFTLQEDYSGAGTYGEPYLSGISDIKYIDCAVVK